MTAKRFILDEYLGIGSVVIDTENENVRFRHENELSMKQCCDLLNELDEKWIDEFSFRETLQQELQKVEEENEKLKSEYKVLHTQYQDLKKFVENNFDEYMTQEKLNRQILKLSDENKELKQSNERLLKMLDNVANYMQKENKYMPIDDFVEWWNGIATKGLDNGDVE